jgi:hypothetical protein
MWKFENPNHTAKWPTHWISICKRLLRNQPKAVLLTKYPNKIEVTDVIHVIETEVSAHGKSIGKMTVMLHSSIYRTALTPAQTLRKLLRYLTFLMVCHGN